MQEIIDQILEGNFDYENGSLDFSCAKLEINISAGEIVEGSFSIHATPGHLTRGYINSTDLRMECLTPEFCCLKVADLLPEAYVSNSLRLCTWTYKNGHPYKSGYRRSPPSESAHT